jgi:hypothetical protein
VLTGVFLFLLAGGYYFCSFLYGNLMHQSLVYRYRLQSGNLDDLHRYAPVIEAQMRELPALKDVSVDTQLNSDQAIVDVDHQKPTVPDVMELPTMTVSFSLAPNDETQGGQNHRPSAKHWRLQSNRLGDARFKTKKRHSRP